MTTPHILIVDDDARIRQLLGKFLGKNGFLTTTARDAAQARRLLAGLEFDLIVLDVMMPGEDGVALTRALRSSLTTPILLLTARGEAEERIIGLEAGADDYLPKPFEPRELLLRISAILRRTPPTAAAEPPKVLYLGALRYDLGRGELWENDTPVRLTSGEGRLLQALADRAGDPVSRDDLAHAVDGSDAANTRAIDVQVTRLRRKLEADPKQPRYLQTVRGEGYRLLPD